MERPCCGIRLQFTKSTVKLRNVWSEITHNFKESKRYFNISQPISDLKKTILDLN